MNETTPPARLDMSQRRFTQCQADEDGCDYEHCPRWRDGEIINEAHCTLDIMEPDVDE